MELKANERIDDLEFKGLKIIQKKDGFCFGIDAVLLSDFAKKIKKANCVVDLCTGTGIIAILLSGKIEAKEIIGVEIQREYAEMATRSIVLNNLEEQVKIINSDLRNLSEEIIFSSVDAVTVNPPYIEKGNGLENDNEDLKIARHEVNCTLEDVIRETARILKSNGTFYMVHKPERLVDIFCIMRKYKIEPKRIRFVHPRIGTMPNMILIEGLKNGKRFLKVEKPLYVYDKEDYTREIYDIYNKK